MLQCAPNCFTHSSALFVISVSLPLPHHVMYHLLLQKIALAATLTQGGHSLGRKKFKDFSRTLNSLFQTYSVDVSAKLQQF